MSWHFSRGLVAAYSEANCLDGELFAPSNGMIMPEKFYSPDKTMDVLSPSLSGMTCKPLMDDRGADWWISSLGDSHAKISQPQADQIEKDSLEREADFGRKWGESSGKYHLDLCLWKTRQHWLFGGLESCSETWPRWGMMRSGEWWPLPMLAHDTSVRGYGSWPIIGTPIKTQRGRSEAFISPAKNPFELCLKGYLPHPSWVEGLMGWPDGWTDLSGSAMDKFQLWLRKHGIFSLPPSLEQKNVLDNAQTSNP